MLFPAVPGNLLPFGVFLLELLLNAAYAASAGIAVLGAVINNDMDKAEAYATRAINYGNILGYYVLYKVYESSNSKLAHTYLRYAAEYIFPDAIEEYKHLKAQAKIAESLGIDKKNIFMLSSGDVLELNEESAEVTDKVPTGGILVDGLGVGDVGNVVLRDRQHLAEDGIMIVVLSLEKTSGEIVAGPDIVSRGFVYVKESDELIEEARCIVDEALQSCLDKGITDWGKLKTTTKDVLGEFVWRKTKRRPMILPIIMEV